MNKKLFTLLTSAALMAGMAPAVFADTMDFTIKKSEDEAPAGKKVYDVIVKADNGITGMQWYFKSNGDLGNNTDYSKKDNSTNGFHPDKDGVGELFNDDGSLTYTPELYKKPGFETKATAADNYQVAGAATGEETGDVSKGVKIGTLTVGEATEGETWVDVNVAKSKATYTDPSDKSVAKYEWNVITDAETTESKPDSTASEVSVPDSTPDSTPSTPDSTPSTPDSTPDSTPSTPDSTTSSSSAAPAPTSSNAPASSGANGGSNSQGSGNSGNVDTGVASTAVVALAAASAALVVVSKKRK